MKITAILKHYKYSNNIQNTNTETNRTHQPTRLMLKQHKINKNHTLFHHYTITDTNPTTTNIIKVTTNSHYLYLKTYTQTTIHTHKY